MFESLRQDLVYAFRQLRLAPGFTAVATLSLALGIGANTAIVQLVDAIRLRMLPVEAPSELVKVGFAPHSARAGLELNPVMSVEFRSFSEQIRESLLREQLMAVLSGLRRPRRSARHLGSLWRHRLHGRAPPQRNRRPHGLGR